MTIASDDDGEDDGHARQDYGRGCSSVGRASDRHVADAGSIPRCGKGFFSQSQLSVQTLLHVRTPPCAIAFINICAHVRDSVVHVRVQWIMEALKHPECTVGWVARLCGGGFPRGQQPEFLRGEIPMRQYQL